MKTKKSKIMLVIESQNLRAVLKECFKKIDYVIKDFEDGKSAIRGYRHGCCDICLLDIDLSKKDGYEVIKELRCVTPDLPVVFITEKESKDERIKSFEAGCEDYISKPFSTDELLLRLEAILSKCSEKTIKRNTVVQETICNMGEVVINYNEMKLVCGEKVYRLTRKEAELLKILFQHKNKLVPREILLKEIWGDAKAASGRSLDVFISKLRQYFIFNEKVEIVTIHGTGYLLKITN